MSRKGEKLTSKGNEQPPPKMIAAASLLVTWLLEQEEQKASPHSSVGILQNKSNKR